MDKRVLVLATVETKASEVHYLAEAMSNRGLTPEICDISLLSGGKILSAADKLARMESIAQQVLAHVITRVDHTVAIIGIGGGTGGEIILRILRGLPLAFPKLLVSTLPFDPRAALADNAITIIPTLADIAGLNASLRQIFDNTAAMVSGLAQSAPQPTTTADNATVNAPVKAIGITALGATQGACEHLLSGLHADAYETMVFHANGYGGAAFARFARDGAFHAILDMTVHEITRTQIAGVHAPMPDRFTCASHLPRVVLPGGINFIGLGTLDELPPVYTSRAHYQHSGFFTHVALTLDEAENVTQTLSAQLNRCTGPVHVILPMGGFSREDRAGGAMENPALRDTVARTFEANAAHFTVSRLPHHINDPETAAAAISALRPFLKDTQ
jgi:uncharacterized protein (UPF0261 family)